MSGSSSSHGITLDPPFRGYIDTTFDALLVFEAAKRGMIPRVTRRLIERERSMVQSGAVFVFDEQESGIKRWTDGLTWSPSRILGNFLVYRETSKPPGQSAAGSGTDSPSNTPAPPVRVSTTTAGTMGPPHGDGLSSTPPSGYGPPLGLGALQRPRSVSEGDGLGMDRRTERQLVGSLTNSHKFREDGLVKKTMSVTVNGYTQHMISYYTTVDVKAGRLRTPSTIMELAALEISPDYLAKQNFRNPPHIEVGPDGIPRYRGEVEEPGSPQTPSGGGQPGFYLPGEMPYDQYGAESGPPSAGPGMMRYDPPPDMRQHRPAPLAAPIPIPGHPHPQHPPHPEQGYYPPPSPYYEQGGAHIQRENSMPGRMPRPNSSQARRYEPYGGTTSPRSSGHMALAGPGNPQSRKSSQGGPVAMQSIQQGGPPDFYPPPPPTAGSSSSAYDIKPSSLPLMSPSNPFAYNPPPSAGQASFSGLYVPDARVEGAPLHSPGIQHTYQASPTSAHAYPGWPSAGGQPSRLIPTNQAGPPGHQMRAPGSAGSSGSPTSLPAPSSSGTDRGAAWPNPGPPPPLQSVGHGGQQQPRSHMPNVPISPLGQPPWDPRQSHPPPGQHGDSRNQQTYAVDQWQ